MARRHDIDRRIFELALGNDGAVSRHQLLDRGISPNAIDRRVRSAALERVIAGYYVVPELRSSTSSASAILLAHPDSALSHLSAGERLGFRLGRREKPVAHVVAAHGASVPASNVVVHETRHLPAVDVITIGGQRVTSAGRTICDLAAVLSARQLLHLVETQLAARAPDPEAMRACYVARRRGGVGGIGRLGHVLAELLDDEPFPKSKLELEVLRGLERRRSPARSCSDLARLGHGPAWLA